MLKKMCGKLSLPFAVATVLLLISGSWALSRAADAARDGQKFNRPTGLATAGPQSLPVPALMGGLVRADTSSHALTMDASGNVYNQDASRDRDNKIWTTPVTDTVSAFTADSTVSGPFYTGQMSRMFLRVQVTWPNAVHDSLGQRQHWCRFAVQVRAHLTSQTDSLNTNPWYVYADSTRESSFPLSRGPMYTLSSAIADSGGYRMSSLTGAGALTANAQTTPLPSELIFTAIRTQPGTGAYGSNYYGEPTNFYIPLADSRGVFFWAPYTSIRIRTLANYLVNIDAQPKYTVDLVGTSLR